MQLTGDDRDDDLVYVAGIDLIDGQGGRDTANFSQFGAAVWVDLEFPGIKASTQDSDTLDGGIRRALTDLVNIENLAGTAFNDQLFGDGADNCLIYTGGFDLIDGRAGSDTVDFSPFNAAVWVDLDAGAAWTRDSSTPGNGPGLRIADLHGIESIIGTAFDDHLSGDDGGNVLIYTAGLDVLDGAGGFDTADFSPSASGVWVDLEFTGGPEAWAWDGTPFGSGTWHAIADLSGIEAVVGSRFDDVLKGDDGFNLFTYIDGRDMMDGRGGTDLIDFSYFHSAVWVDLAVSGGAQARTRDGSTLGDGTWRDIVDISNIEYVIGSPFDDEIAGDHEWNVFIYSGGLDKIDGRDGSDTIDFADFGAAVWVDLASDTGAQARTRDAPSLDTGAWREIAFLTNIEDIVGTIYNDDLSGDDGTNAFIYNGGTDRFDGRGGSDTADFTQFSSAVWVNLALDGLEAWTRNSPDLESGTWRGIADLHSIEHLVGTPLGDVLIGDGGSNTLIGFHGDDTLTGGGADDWFIYAEPDSGLDTITDFTPGVDNDVLDLRELLSASGADASNAAEFVRLEDVSGNTVVSADTDGGADSFTPIFVLDGVTGLSLNQLLADGNLLVA